MLPDGYRAVLVLRDVDGLSTEESADALGESVSSVKSRLHRARMALREVITRSLAPKRAPALPRGEGSRPACILGARRRVKALSPRAGRRAPHERPRADSRHPRAPRRGDD